MKEFKSKQIVGSAIGVVMGALLALPATASYLNLGGSADFSLLGTAWDPGADTARVGGNPAPGGATWSVMGAGIGDGFGNDPHGGADTTLLSALYAGGVNDEVTTIGLALQQWADNSGFTNLGQVADGGGAFGAAGAAGNLGDIRIGAIFIDGNVGGNVLAHAYQPGNASIFLNGNIAGDMHFDNGNTWADCMTNAACDGAGAVDFHTVAIHELGHALGLDHSGVVGSIMEAFYGGPRRTLHADDIAGIQAIYGLNPVPLPASFVLFGSALMGLVGLGKRRRNKVNTLPAI